MGGGRCPHQLDRRRVGSVQAVNRRSFHKVSKKHLDRYVEELEWRFGNRDNDHIFVDTPRRIVRMGNLTYRDLVK